MAICSVDENGYCARHKTVHLGRTLGLALDPGPLGEHYRNELDKTVQQTRQGQRRQTNKPRISIQALSERRRSCKEKKRLGLPCPDDPASAARPDSPSSSLEKLFKAQAAPIPPPAQPTASPDWAFGVTTVPERRHTTLPATLKHLQEAGFKNPLLFVDGGDDPAPYQDLETAGVTLRKERLGIVRNWYASFRDLFRRYPEAKFYALFQDDIKLVRNIRRYIEQAGLPDKAYFNLFTFLDNEEIIRNNPHGWYESKVIGEGGLHRQQTGRGALALVFPRPAALELLTSDHMTRNVLGATKKEKLDGLVVESMNLAGYREYVHNPSLVSHTADAASTKGKRVRYPASRSFVAEFDPLGEETLRPPEPATVAPAPTTPGTGLRWSYGVTTCPSRLTTYLPITLESLARAGFTDPILFVDGAEFPAEYYLAYPKLDVRCRKRQLGVVGAWIAALMELYLANPRADRYGLFQDDLQAYRNLRAYLDAAPYPDRGYLNLYTFTAGNEEIVRGKPIGWYEAGLVNSKERNPNLYQTGRGAVALVFNREAVTAALSSPGLIHKPSAEGVAGRTRIDGALVTSMNNAGFREYIHNPSLCQHIGHRSSREEAQDPTSGAYRYGHMRAHTWRGEGFDALELLKGK